MTQFHHEWRPTRRDVLASGVAAAGATTAGLLPAGGVHAAGTERLRIGLIGCGGRGTGAARQALAAHPAVQLVAMGDLFADHLDESVRLLARDGGRQCNCPSSRQFVGHDAWRHVLDAGIDAVILAATPWSRPLHFAAAVATGLHVYAERPAAANLEGMRLFLTASEQARARGLVVVSGLADRHHRPSVETIGRIRDGAIGRPRHVTCRASIGVPWHRPTQPSWTPHEQRLRNWVTDGDLSGGPFLERHLDAIDRGLQALGDSCPVSAAPVGGSSGQAVRYRFAGGEEFVAEIVRSRHLRGALVERVSGTAGTADLLGHRIDGSDSWAYEGTSHNRWQACMDSFVHAILNGGTGDGGLPLCQTTQVALLGRMAMETGRDVAWSELVGPTVNLTDII
jgi:predicted dehydrogenase